MIWHKNTISINDENHEAFCPVIISASRATDIPAFYGKWFMNRLKEGFLIKTNPFNGSKQVISFEKTRLIVFWTKNPRQILDRLKEIDAQGINYYFQFTLNNYDKENFEPSLPDLKSRIKVFKQLSEQIGKDKIIWRFDPLILSNSLTINDLKNRISELAEELYNHTNKLVISFIELKYKKVLTKLKQKKISLIKFDTEMKSDIINFLTNLKKMYNFDIRTCADEDDYSHMEIFPNKCIDDELIIKLFRHDTELMEYLGINKQQLFDFNHTPLNLKDKGQRKYCKCIYSKDIGAYNTCAHFCVYCYANGPEKAVIKNIEKHDPNLEILK